MPSKRLNFVLGAIKNKNKAGYTATPVACGWAGAIFEVTRPFGQEHWGHKNEITKKVKRDQPTNRPTDRQTNKAGCRVACMRLKNKKDGGE